MNLFRYSRDVYGQQTLEGVSWDLFWVFLGLAVVMIVGHAAYKFVTDRRKSADG